MAGLLSKFSIEKEKRETDKKVEDLKKMTWKGIKSLTDVAFFLDRNYNAINGSRDQILGELRNQKFALEYEKLEKTKSRPINYKVNLLTYDQDKDYIKRQPLAELYKTKEDIDRRLRDLQVPENLERADALVLRNMSEVMARQELGRDPTDAEIREVEKVQEYKREVAKELKETSELILKAIHDKRFSTTFTGKWMKPLTQKEKIQILKSIKF